MGLKNLFKKNERTVAETLNFKMPITGRLISIEEVPDPVFSEKMMGDGFAIEPTEGKVYAPVAGKILNVFPTKHAIGMQTACGLEILIHFGMDTVELDGKGFTAHIEKGQTVAQGDLLLEVNLESIREQVPSLITPIVFTNLGDRIVELKKIGQLNYGEEDILEIQ